MTPKRLPPDDPREWLNRARANLMRASTPLAGGYLEDLCFDAQQATEKAIKAVFVGRAERFPFIHDLEKLLGLLDQNGQSIPKYVWQAEKLSRYAAVTRYPGVVRQLLRASIDERSASRRRCYVGRSGTLVPAPQRPEGRNRGRQKGESARGGISFPNCVPVFRQPPIRPARHPPTTNPPSEPEKSNGSGVISGIDPALFDFSVHLHRWVFRQINLQRQP